MRTIIAGKMLLKQSLVLHRLGHVSRQALCGQRYPLRQHDRAGCAFSNKALNNNEEEDRYSSSEDDVVGFGRVIRDPRKTKADVLRESLGRDASGSSKAKGTLEKTGKPVILSNNSEDEQWNELDQHINEYPGERSFKAIGSGGDDFVSAMRQCVEQVLGKSLDDNAVDTKLSSGGKYISVTFGPVMIESPDQIKDIYEKMQQDGRMKFFI
jgi:putative lipoic acid-binding regulatory protein